jgi:hypothetical protein
LTIASTSTGPSWASATAIPSFTWVGSLEADAADPDGLRHRREVRVLELGPEIEKSGGFLLELNEAERAVIEYNDLHC